MIDWSEYAKFFAGLVAIVNPVGAIPVFIALTESQSPEERRHTGVRSALSVALVLGTALVMGDAILRFFGITIASFRVGGGFLIMLISISMMHGTHGRVRQTEEEALDAAVRDSVAVVPLGIPFLAGPGAISSIILFSQRADSPAHYGILVGEILVVSLLVWGCFRAAPFVEKTLGRTGINVVTRIMGLIMASIGVEFIASGLRQLFPGLN